MAQPSGGSCVVTTWTALELVVAWIRVSWGRTMSAVWSSAHLMYTVNRLIITIQYCLYHIIYKLIGTPNIAAAIKQHCDRPQTNQLVQYYCDTRHSNKSYGTTAIHPKQINQYNNPEIHNKQIN